MKLSRQRATLARHVRSEMTGNIFFAFSVLLHVTPCPRWMRSLPKILGIPKPSAALLSSFLLFFTKTNQLPLGLFLQAWH